MTETVTFVCSICSEPSTEICVYCTKDACWNHRCERCKRCSDCCECEVPLAANQPEARTPALEVMAAHVNGNLHDASPEVAPVEHIEEPDLTPLPEASEEPDLNIPRLAVLEEIAEPETEAEVEPAPEAEPEEPPHGHF